MELSFLTDSTAPAYRAFDDRIVARWNEAHPDRRVALSIRGHEDLRHALPLYLTTRPGPDVLTWFAENRARFFRDQNLIMELSSLWEAEGFNDIYAPSFQSLARIENRIYFVPTSYYWWAIYYRPSLFREVGVKAPIETWDELLAACDAFSAAGKRAFAIGTRFRCPAAAWFDYLNMRINGPEFHSSLMRLAESYTDDRVKAVFDYWKQLLDRKGFIDNAVALDEQDAVDFMARGEAGMCLSGAYITDVYASALEDDLDFFRFPIINPDVPLGEDAPTDGYFIAANTANPEGAKAFLAFLGSQQVQQWAFDELNRLPTRTDVNTSGGSPATQKGIELIQSAGYMAQFYDLDTTAEMAQAGMDVFVRFLQDPAGIAGALEELESLRQRLALDSISNPSEMIRDRAAS